MLLGFHHVALIVSDYHQSKVFYCDLLGFKVIAETYRVERESYKLDLQLPDGSQIELFSFPHPPHRPSNPESCGLRHLAFKVTSVSQTVKWLADRGIECEPIRTDPLTQRAFTFFKDPDGIPLEIYQIAE